MIDLYTWTTPNGRKVSIMLAACGLPYREHAINILEGDQFTEAFTAISPNQKIPAIVDPEGPDGAPISVFETGAILIYLAEKTGKFLSSEPRARLETLQWLMWQMGGFGPFLGQAHHFNRFAKEDIPYAKERYTTESKRLWGVLNTRLANREFVVDELSIADFAIYPWAMRYEWQGVDPTEFPNVAAWMARMDQFEFVKQGMATLEDPA